MNKSVLERTVIQTSSDHTEAVDCLFTSEPWIKTLDSVFGFSTQVLRTPTEPFWFTPINNFIGKRILSTPYSDYMKTNMDADQLAVCLNEISTRYPDYKIQLRILGQWPKEKFSPDYALETKTACHTVKITSLSNIWEHQLSSIFKRGIKKAQKNNVVVKKDQSMEAITRFYQMFKTQRMDKFGILTPPLKFFEAVHTNFFTKDLGFCLEAYFEGQ